MDRHFLYVFDPMCSWCYGFQPVMAALARHFAGHVPVRLMVGGLRAGNTKAVREEDKEFFRNAWGRVGTATGRSFNTGFFERQGFVYDTEPACRAVVAGRMLDVTKALAFAGAVCEAFYGHNRDTTELETLADIAAQTGYDRAMFAGAMLDPDVRNATFKDFLNTKQMGVEGFPCLLLSHADGYALVTSGYRPIDGMIPAIEKFLTGQTVTQ
jgi:putative protein-disulfide isomerase